MPNAMTITTPTDREIVITRAFSAPIGLVWKSLTTPELLRKWLFLPPGWEMSTCEEDVRAGGMFRWAWSSGGAPMMSMHGRYLEVSPPIPGSKSARLVRTETFDTGCQPQAGEQHCTLTLTEELAAGSVRTTMRLTVVYPSKQARDAALASGMEHGMRAGYDQLDAMLAG